MYTTRVTMGIAALIVIISACISPAAAAYNHNDTIWSSSGNQFIMEHTTSMLAGEPHHYSDGYAFNPNAGTFVYIYTPFVNSVIRDGIHPKVKYFVFPLKMPVGVNATYVTVSNGQSSVYSKNVNWAGTGAYKEYSFAMDSYKNMNRGISVIVRIKNDKATAQVVYSYGASVKQEW